MPGAPNEDPSGRLLIAVFAAVMGAFVIISLISQHTTAKIESPSNQIASISAPSIEHLAAMRSVVFEVQLTLSKELHSGGAPAEQLAALDSALKSLNDDVQGYLTLPILQDEESYWRQIHAALAHFDDAVRRTRELIRDGAISDAREEFAQGVEPSGRQLIEAALSAIDFHARNSRSYASAMKAARKRAVVMANISSGVCVLFGIAGILLIRRQTRRHRALLRAQSEFHETRAKEYEQFAGRVAHDIKNPLSSAHMAAHLALRRAGDDSQRESIERILRALSRADAITTGLLEFARSGAKPDPGARADVREVLEDFVRGLGPELEHLGIEVQIEPVPPVLVACCTGVYLSLVGNLVRNAIKYVGQTEPRRVRIGVTEMGSLVRTDVADTGPGIDAENLPTLFEPYFRVTHARSPDGLGLGLATVKRLAEGHHGSVGVSSEPGKGSTFWFTLPRAGTAGTSLAPHETHPEESHPPEVRH
jgi:signal transduction histidine kinase